jgi:type IV secretory pathway VirB4 component
MHCFVLTKSPEHSEKLQLLSIDENAVHKNDRFKSLDAGQQHNIDNLTTILRIVVKEAHDKLKSELVARLENMQKERLAEEERKYVEQQRQLDETADLVVLGHLNFASKNVRRDEIHDAHRTTFSWIFKDPEIVRASGDVAENTRPWNNFVEWLKRGKDIYWINGKAGSGKSTLMRYIVENAETFEHLREWAEPAELRVASFYFWHSGLPEQRSQSGLFRSLL